MLDDILLLFRIRITGKVNGFFYYFKKPPLIGRLLKESCYTAVSLKEVLSVFSFLVDVLMNLLKNLLCLLVVIAVPLINLQEGANDMQIRNGFLFGFVLLSLVAGSTSNNKLLTTDGETFILSRQVHMTARRCLCSRDWHGYSMNAIGLFLACLFLPFMFSLPFWYVLMTGFGCLGSHQCMDMLQMRHFQGKNSFCLQASTWKLFIPLDSLILLYTLYWLSVDFSFTPQLFYIFALVYAAAIIPYLCPESSYHAYSELLTCLPVKNYEILKLDNSQIKQMEVTVDERSHTSEELQYRTKNTGYALLDELFLRRYKHPIYRPVRSRLTVMIAFWPTGTCLLIVLKDDMRLTRDILGLLPPFVFLSYILSILQRVRKTMLMNCDVSLLHYSYYHSKEAVPVNFRFRLKRLYYYNLLLIMVPCLYMNSTVVLVGLPYTLSMLLLFDFALLCPAMFFSVHYLFAYYIFQSRNKQFDMKNPFMSILNGLMYPPCYFCIRLEGGLLSVSGVLAATFLYIPAALLLVYRLMPKTSHLKWWLRLLVLPGSNRSHGTHSNNFGSRQK